jgi:AraC-like DNA-binding protein
MDIKNELIPQIAASGKELDYFTYSHDGKKYRVTYLTRGLNDWQIISLQDYDAVLTNVRQIRWTAAIVTASVVLLTILISIYFSIKLYRPIGHLMTLVRRNEGRGGDMHRDELSLIASSYSQMTDKLKELQQDQAAQQNIAKVYRLRNLIAGSTGVPEQDLAHDRAQYGLDIPVTGGMIVALSRIDNLQEVQARTPEATMSLLYFAICNIGQELIRGSYSCEAVDMKNGHVVFIIGHAGGISHEELRTILRELQDTVRHYYHITVTMSVSPVFSSYRDITAMYGQALRYADYRMILGKEALIEPSLVQPNEECSQFHIPPELDRQLIEGLKSGDWERINGGMEKWLELVRTFSFENMFSAMLHMFVTLGNTINEMNQNNLQAASVNLQEINRRILEKETLEEVKEVFLDLVRQALDKRNSGREEKARLVAETIREIVARQYADPDLNVQKIADMLRMSHVYLGQVFKEQEGITVVDCINETRLAQARLYLEQHQMTVAEIMEKVGFSNESYFYRLFKRRYGTTPKEYRLKAAINRNA